MEISDSVFQTIKRFPQVRCVLSSFALDAVGYAIKHLCGLLIERPLFHAHGFRQLKARELGAILPQRNARQEKDTQLSLTINDSIAPCQALLSGRAELRDEVYELLQAQGLPTALDGEDPHEIVLATERDKKRVGEGPVPFVLVDRKSVV